MKPSVKALLLKAAQACVSAKMLLEADDLEGACNRAYYGMFHAARAALIWAAAQGQDSKSHSGVISAFGLRFVKSGELPAALGRSINLIEQVRIIADYREGGLDKADVIAAIDQANIFVELVTAKLSDD